MNDIYRRQNIGGLTWLEDWREFFYITDILPDFHQDVPEQFNCLSRIMIFLILFMYLFYGFNRYVVVLTVMILAMIILYLVLYKNIPIRPMKESYQCPRQDCAYQPPIILYDSKSTDPVVISGTNMNPSLIDARQANTWCQPDIPLEELTGLNQSLAGPANPKTNVIPVVPPPIYDGETWMPNDLVVPFKINDQRRQELQQNGYMTWEKEIPGERIRSELAGACRSPISDVVREDYASPSYSSAMYNQTPNRAAYTGDVMDTACGGYYPENARYNYPVNAPPTNCMLPEYNKNLYSIPLQPGVYTRSQVNQPDASMSNLGISFTQPHLPYTCQMDERGNMMFDEYDPNQYPSEYLLRGRDRHARDAIPRNEIYDPRLTGYGTSYRSYIDQNTGQPRFYYNDVDAHTQYNFISRNKVDFTEFAPTSGPYPGLPPDDFRPLADQTFHDDVIRQRTDLQYRLMAKNSHREWQQRSAPIQTMGYGRAGCGTSSSASYAGPRGSGY